MKIENIKKSQSEMNIITETKITSEGIDSRLHEAEDQ